MRATEVLQSLSPRIARSTPVWAVVPSELRSAWAVRAELRAYAESAEPPEYAADSDREEPRARAAEQTRVAADPSCPERAGSSATGHANLPPSPGSLGDCPRSAAVSARWERGWR